MDLSYFKDEFMAEWSHPAQDELEGACWGWWGGVCCRSSLPSPHAALLAAHIWFFEGEPLHVSPGRWKRPGLCHLAWMALLLPILFFISSTMIGFGLVS